MDSSELGEGPYGAPDRVRAGNRPLPGLRPLPPAPDAAGAPFRQAQGYGMVHPAGCSNARCRSGYLERLGTGRSEEHTSELQSQSNLVCRLLLDKKNNKKRET